MPLFQHIKYRIIGPITTPNLPVDPVNRAEEFRSPVILDLVVRLDKPVLRWIEYGFGPPANEHEIRSDVGDEQENDEGNHVAEFTNRQVTHGGCPMKLRDNVAAWVGPLTPALFPKAGRGSRIDHSVHTFRFRDDGIFSIFRYFVIVRRAIG
jgi:hypothetical protein